MTIAATTQHLKNNGIAVVPTDTLYGLVGPALQPTVVDQIYALKGRDPSKPMIVLISSLSDLEHFDIHPSTQIADQFPSYWPGPVSILLPCPDPKFAYLHRGTDEIAFRLPNNPQLLDLLRATGPLVAPSANPESQPPATTIDQARQYFGDQVHYLDGGLLTGTPSRLLRLHSSGSPEVLR